MADHGERRGPKIPRREDARMRKALGIAAVAALALTSVPGSATAGEMVSCTMTYTLKGWSAFYKTSKGEGTVTCNNGQSAAVKVKAKGGGITFGKSEVLDGEGTFSDVKDIGEIFGSYAAAEAHAGAVKSTHAAVYTKGEISLALAGTGRGVDVGVAFGAFTIEKK